MQEGPQSPPSSVASVGFGIGRCLRRLSEQVQLLGRSVRTGYQGATYTEERHVRPVPVRPTTPVRAFGFFLVGFQAIALMLMVANDGSPGVPTRYNLSPFGLVTIDERYPKSPIRCVTAFWRKS